MHTIHVDEGGLLMKWLMSLIKILKLNNIILHI